MSKQNFEQAWERFGAKGIDPKAVLAKALSRGGDLAELYFEELESTRISIEDRKVDKIVDGIDRGVGLRVIFENRSVYGYTTDLTQGALMTLAESLAQAVDVHEGRTVQAREIPDWRWSEQRAATIRDYSVQEPPKRVSISDRIALARRAEKGARDEFSEAKQVSAIILDSERKILVVNSDGLVSSDSKTYLSCYTEVVGEKDGRIESAHEGDGGFVGLEFFKETTPESIGKECARRVKVLLSAVPAPAGTLPVVLSADAGGTMIHEAVGHGLEADLACNGLSVYQNKIGQQVASKLITVIDDGTIPAKRGSYRFDDEGNPSKKTVLIENGILKGYLVDRISALKFDLEPTGNGRRETFRHRPIVRMTNTYIAPGKDDPAQILADTKKGIFVKAMGGGQVNTVTGDFVFAVTEGYLIQDGKLGPAIRGATLVGNGPKAMMIVDRVGNDLGYAIGTCGKDGQGAPVTDAQPTLRIPELTVGGEVPASTYFGD